MWLQGKLGRLKFYFSLGLILFSGVLDIALGHPKFGIHILPKQLKTKSLLTVFILAVNPAIFVYCIEWYHNWHKRNLDVYIGSLACSKAKYPVAREW